MPVEWGFHLYMYILNMNYAHSILAFISAALINMSLAIVAGVLITECVFPLSYIKFVSQTRPKQGAVLIIEGALMSAKIR